MRFPQSRSGLFLKPPTIHMDYSQRLLCCFPIATEVPDTTPHSPTPQLNPVCFSNPRLMTKWQRAHYLEKMYLETYLILYTRMSSRWIIYLNLSNTPQKYYKKPWSPFNKFQVGKAFLTVTQNPQMMKINNLINLTR